MKCPYCNSMESKVIDKRNDPDFNRRRRECSDCKARYTTYEKVELKPLLIKKKNRRGKEKFNIQKLRHGIDLACEKRPITEDVKQAVAERIEKKLRTMSKTQQNTRYIGNMLMQELKNIDPVAYLRFASVYQNFKSVKAFESEMKKLRG